jgi:hypothetical protein
MKVLSRIVRRRVPIAGLAAALVLVALATPRRAAGQIFAQPEGDQWGIAVALNPWLPTVNGDLKYELPSGGTVGGDFNVKIGPNDYLTHLKFALPIVIDIRNQRYSVLTDVTYLNLSQDSNITAVRPAGEIPITVTGNLNTTIELKGLLWTEAFGWTLAGNPSGSLLDMIVGVRYFGLRTDTKWHLESTVEGPGGNQAVLAKDGKESRDSNLWDGVFGVRGKAQLGEHFYIPYYADIGLGTSKLTWSGNLGFAWAPGKVEIALCYKYMSWAQKNDKLVTGLRLGGPQFSIGYRF